MQDNQSPDTSADQASPPPPPLPPPAHPVGYATPASYGYPGPYDGPPPDNDSRTMGMLSHLLGIFTSVLAPLIIWLLKKDEKPFVDDQGKEALNFQLTVLIAYVASMLLTCVTLGFGGLLFIPLFVIVIIFGIMGAVAANKGEAYRYPVNIRMIK
jgi:uncharacterized Tic20 family protein